MKTIHYIAVGLLISLSLGGCKKDYLDVEPSTLVTDSQLKKMPKNISDDIRQGLFNGMYALLYRPGSGGENSNRDFGQKSIDLKMDALTADFVRTNSSFSWMVDDQLYQATTNHLHASNYQIWRFYFRLVYSANEILQSYPEDSSKLSEDDRARRGQALTMRGYAYFYLTQLLAPEYQPQALLCPLYTDPDQENLSITSQEQIYAQIVKDLTEAKTLLHGFKRDQKYEFDESVASAFLALTYGAMGNYTEVERLTDELVSSDQYKPFTAKQIVYDEDTHSGGGFNSVDIDGVMWGTKITADMGLTLYSFFGMIDPYFYSYAYAGSPTCINDSLYRAIHTDDIRRKQFVDWSKMPTYQVGAEERKNPFYRNAAFVNLPSNKFFAPSRILNSGRQMVWDYIYMRIDEMYLLNAEAKAFLGKETEAKAVLKGYLADRITDLSYIDKLDIKGLKDEIYLQFRIEFLGEGKSYLAMKRFKATIYTGQNRYDSSNRDLEIPYNDTRMYYKIPDAERRDNPNLNLPAGM